MPSALHFDHERLDVYQVSIEFVAWTGALLDGPLASCRLSAVKHLDRASTSVPLNIAEGNGKRSLQDRCRYLDIARGSAFECAACLDVLVARSAMPAPDIVPGKELLARVVGMLSRMVEDDREAPGEHEHEHEHDT
jgi:four helix bundle protein